MSNMMIQKKHFLLLEAFLFLIFLVGCTTRKNISGEEHKYEQLSELPGTTHTKRLKQFVLLKMLHLWKKTSTKKLNYGGMQPKRKCSSVEEKKK